MLRPGDEPSREYVESGLVKPDEETNLAGSLSDKHSVVYARCVGSLRAGPDQWITVTADEFRNSKPAP